MQQYPSSFGASSLLACGLESQAFALSDVENETILQLCRNCLFPRLVLQTNAGLSLICLDVQTDGMDVVGRH